MNAKEILTKSFKIYGGCSAILNSKYLKVAIVITILCWRLWTQPGYWELPISIMPNIIGFTLAGFAILLAFGDTKFFSLISFKENDEHSPFFKFATTFIIFIITQTTALLYAIIMKSWFDNPIMIYNIGLTTGSILRVIQILLQGFGFIVFIYSMFLVIAAAVEVFRIVNWLEIYHTSQHNKEKDSKKKSSV